MQNTKVLANKETKQNKQQWSISMNRPTSYKSNKRLKKMNLNEATTQTRLKFKQNKKIYD